MKLSDRLLTIAKEINFGETMADIGTDHGFLPLYLLENNISPKAIMADISRGSLNKADENCKLFYPNKKFDLRLGSGISVLQPYEVDAVVIAGMGGILISDILSEDLGKSHSINKFILQPRNNVGKLRNWLYNNGFIIVKESLVRESRFICEILTVENNKAFNENDIKTYDFNFDFPHSLIDFKNSLTKEYLLKHLEKENYIKEKIVSGKVKTSNEIIISQQRIKLLEDLLKELEE